jgi:phosphodiesterase/alkaline phosphatase D-like protein
MAIAIRAKRGLTRRQLLVRSAVTAALAGLGGLARPYLSRVADRPQITSALASSDVSGGSAVVWSKADRPARMQVECATAEGLKTILRATSSEALPEHTTLLRRCCSKVCRPDRIFSTGYALNTSLKGSVGRGLHLRAKSPQARHILTMGRVFARI